MFSVNQITRDARASIAQELDNVDEGINEQIAEIQDSVASCEGTLSVSVVSPQGNEYSITICTTELGYDEEGEGHLPAHIQRPPDMDTLFGY